MAKLKAKVTVEEFNALGKDLQGFYGPSPNGSDGFVLDAEGVEDVTGLKKVLEEVKSDRAKLREQMQQVREQYGDIDPEKARKAMAELEKMHDKKLLDEGKVEELIIARTDRMRQEHENQVKARDKKIAELEQANKSFSERLSSVLIDSTLTQVLTKSGVKPVALEDAIVRGRKVWKLDDTDKPVPYKPDGTIFIGKDAKSPITAEEWASILQQEAPHLFETSAGSGSDAGKSGLGNLRGRQIVISREQARDPQTFRAARDEAAKIGGDVVVQD